MVADRPTPLDVRVQAMRFEADGVLSVEFRRLDGGDLPEWAPGAHVSVHLPSGRTRQYSLNSHPDDRSHYRVGVLKVVGGEGGSAEVHDLRVGDRLQISPPINAFPLADDPAVLLIAGGIGITPILAMTRALRARGTAFQLVYAGREESSMAFLGEVRALVPDVVVVSEREHGRPDLEALIAAHPGVPVYACGPGGMLDALTAICDRLGVDLRVERFAPDASPVAAGDLTAPPEFSVRLARTGRTVGVHEGESILSAVRAAGVSVDSSCEMGVCGTCETRVLAGRIDHRDLLLSPTERERGDTMMICVSRGLDGDLDLDL